MKSPPLWSRHRIFSFCRNPRLEGQMTSCVISNSWREALCRGPDVPQLTCTLSRLPRQVNRAKHTSIEIREAWHKLCDDTEGGVPCCHAWVQGVRERCCRPPFTEKTDSFEQTTGADPRTGRTMNEPDGGTTCRANNGRPSDKLVLTKSIRGA